MFDQNENQSSDIETETSPKFCEHYKFLLVEELLLIEDYRELHYGNCSIIGKIYETPDGNFQLENIQIPNLPKEYSLPEGTLSIPLLIQRKFETLLLHGKFYEICGEVVLVNNKYPIENQLLKSACDVIHKCTLANNAEEAKEIADTFKETYHSAIRVEFIDEIFRASELIECNLQMRFVNE